MQIITGITSEPKQSISIPLPDGSSFTLRLAFAPQQVGWFYDILYSTRTVSFECNGRRLVTSPNILRQFQNIIPFGIAVITQGSVEPTTQTTFSDGIVTLLLLTPEDITVIESTIYMGSVARNPFGYTAGEATYYNIEQTATFTATCPMGQSGDPVTRSVTVPAGDFNSTVSMEDANAIAYASALSQATDQANAALVCVIGTAWRKVEFNETFSVYWRVLSASAYTQDINGFNATYSGADAYMSSAATFDVTNRDDYTNTEIEFDYAMEQPTNFRNGGGGTITVLAGVSSHYSASAPNSDIGNGISFENVTMSAGVTMTVTNFRYRFRD